MDAWVTVLTEEAPKPGAEPQDSIENVVRGVISRQPANPKTDTGNDRPMTGIVVIDLSVDTYV